MSKKLTVEERLRAGIREALDHLDHPDLCVFWACPGPEHEPVDMASCRVCFARHALQQALKEQT